MTMPSFLGGNVCVCESHTNSRPETTYAQVHRGNVCPLIFHINSYPETTVVLNLLTSCGGETFTWKVVVFWLLNVPIPSEERSALKTNLVLYTCSILFLANTTIFSKHTFGTCLEKNQKARIVSSSVHFFFSRILRIFCPKQRSFLASCTCRRCSAPLSGNVNNMKHIWVK